MVDNLSRLSILLKRVTTDEKLMTFHISLYAVLCQTWIDNQCKNPFSISRNRMMRAAKIRSRATYHKIIRDLQGSGYIRYEPSCNPVMGSNVCLK